MEIDELDAFVLSVVENYPAVQSVCRELIEAGTLMGRDSDSRWHPVGEMLREEADLLATPQFSQPHSQMTEDWLERNMRSVLAIARKYRGL